ncbi:MAG: hypothetical protein ABI147_13255 [Acidobacteriaceae bacterium]
MIVSPMRCEMSGGVPGLVVSFGNPCLPPDTFRALPVLPGFRGRHPAELKYAWELRVMEKSMVLAWRLPRSNGNFKQIMSMNMVIL